MTQISWWQRTAVFRSNPAVNALPLSAIGLAIVAYSLSRYGASRQLVIGLCAGLVYSGFWKWLYRRYLHYYVERGLRLRASELSIDVLEALVSVPCYLVLVFSAVGSRTHWSGYGAFLFAVILLYPEQKAIHQRIKAKLAEMKSTSQQESVE